MARALEQVLIATLALAACGGGGGADAGLGFDADLGPDADPLAPQSLRETGLYSDWDSETVADGVREFRPEYQLWSDAATKRRWIYLPPGSPIDTSDMDYWIYPVGTRLWKEFSRDGTRVETRLLYKTGPARSDWYMMAYAWNQDQNEATAVPGGADDVLGTSHDIPSSGQCRECHDRMDDIVLGFSAVQIDHDLGGLNLATASAEGLLTAPASGSLAVPDGNGGTAAPALGYLHANCGGCHHRNSPVMDSVNLNLRLEVASLAGGDVMQTPTFLSTVGVTPQRSVPGATAIIEPGSPSASAIHIRMNERGNLAVQMPPLGTEDVDAVGLGIVDAWITALGQ